MIHYAILNGLKPHIASYVTQKAPTAIDDLLSAARVAELTITPIRDTSLHAKVDRLVENWEHSRICATSLQQRPQSPTPNRATLHLMIRLFDRISGLPIIRIHRECGQRRVPINTQEIPGVRALKRAGLFVEAFISSAQCSRFPNQQNFQQSMNQPTSYYPQQRPNCSKCGRPSHSNINSCPAINVTCFGCGHIGHYHRCCRAKQAGNFEDSGQF